MDGITLTIEKEALEYIVDKAIEFKLGARGLRSICETIMNDAMFEMPSLDEKEFTLTRAYAESKIDNLTAQKLRSA